MTLRSGKDAPGDLKRGGIRERLGSSSPEERMWIVVAVVCGLFLAVVLTVLAVVAISVRIEDGRTSITDRASGTATAGTRRLLGVRVDHDRCRAGRPQDACPLCHRHLMREAGLVREDGPPPGDGLPRQGAPPHGEGLPAGTGLPHETASSPEEGPAREDEPSREDATPRSRPAPEPRPDEIAGG
ncbi:hypothetical protein ACFOWE_08965 [Planomonospora corallina]|uniref:Uncharacterized protein n=1 Tax=Planomonospora corallina TaxID=1806052 RepID=A0ABV8I2K8_9ACTN